MRLVLQPRKCLVRKLFHPNSHKLIDVSLVVPFPAPASYTGQDVVEFHVHGTALTITDLFDALAAVPGTRPAHPGEFTRRAFLNGKLDYLQVEGLADLFKAHTTQQKQAALHQLGGHASRCVARWRIQLLHCQATVQLLTDFWEEHLAHHHQPIRAQLFGRVEQLRREIRAVVTDSRAINARVGSRVCFLGVPNAGKSSLANCLARRAASLVSALPGTTRDVLVHHATVAGAQVSLVDMAGLPDKEEGRSQEDAEKETNQEHKEDTWAGLSPDQLSHKLEIAGFRQGAQLLANASAIVVVVERGAEGTQVSRLSKFLQRHFALLASPTHSEKTEDRSLHSENLSGGTIPPLVLVVNKIDRYPDTLPESTLSTRLGPAVPVIPTSAKTGCGVDELERAIVRAVNRVPLPGASTTWQDSSWVMTRERHRCHLRKAVAALENVDPSQPIELTAEHIRIAVRDIGALAGDVDTEEVLGEIFANFCIGK